MRHGANERTRTFNLLITNQLHYQLCYAGIINFIALMAWIPFSRKFVVLSGPRVQRTRTAMKIIFIGRNRGIRTPALTVPGRARYQTAPYSDIWCPLEDSNSHYMVRSHAFYSIELRGLGIAERNRTSICGFGDRHVPNYTTSTR